MKRAPVLLLVGPPGSGKTTVVSKVVEVLPEQLGGFLTREIRRDSHRTGFEIHSSDNRRVMLATKDRPSGFRESVTHRQFDVNIEAIRDVAVPSILDARRSGKIVVIDEIGPMENCCEEFRAAVRTILEDEQIMLLATVALARDDFADEVKAHPRVQLIAVTPENRDNLPSRLAAIVASQLSARGRDYDTGRNSAE